MYGGAVDNNFATNNWVYLYYAPPNVDNITYSDGTTGHTNNFDAASGRSNSAAPTQAVNISDYDSWIGYFQLSRFKFVDDAPRRPGAPRSRQRAADHARHGQPRRLLPRGRRHRLRQAQQPLAADRRRQRRRLGRRRQLGSEHRPADRREPDRPRDERDRRHVHADVQRADDRPARVQLHRRADRDGAAGASATSAPATSRPQAAR